VNNETQLNILANFTCALYSNLMANIKITNPDAAQIAGKLARGLLREAVEYQERIIPAKLNPTESFAAVIRSLA
jgi:hypothetical protein